MTKVLTYHLVDVFTDTAYSGNPLAVVDDVAGLSDEDCLTIAREFNNSETAFTRPPTTSGADYRVRIFTPTAELPFAGHPSVGTASVLLRRGVIEAGRVIQECGAGLLPVDVDAQGARLSGGEPEIGAEHDPAPLAHAVGLTEDDVDGRGRPGQAGCGINFTVMTVRPGSLARVVPHVSELLDLDLGNGLLLVEFDEASCTAKARMFGPASGVLEDAATGSASLALGAWLVDRGRVPGEGTTGYTVSQGVEMGRPSTLECTVSATGGRATGATVRGSVAHLGTGELVAPGRE